MQFTVVDAGGVRVVEGVPGERFVRRPEDASRIVEACLSARAKSALLYADNLTPAFFDLSSAEAGLILDKLRSFRIRLAVVCAPGSVTFSSRFRELVADDLRVFDAPDAARAWLRGAVDVPMTEVR